MKLQGVGSGPHCLAHQPKNISAKQKVLQEISTLIQRQKKVETEKTRYETTGQDRVWSTTASLLLTNPWGKKLDALFKYPTMEKITCFKFKNINKITKVY